MYSSYICYRSLLNVYIILWCSRPRTV